MTITASWRGAALDRMLDELHARLVSAILQILDRYGWISEVEVSFAVFGDRGSIDVLAWHSVECALLVIEVKTELGSLDGLLRPLDVKVRRARQIGLERFGWDLPNRVEARCGSRGPDDETPCRALLTDLRQRAAIAVA